MEYHRLGTSGLRVNRIALGCMSFGDASRGFSEWALGDDAAEPIFRQALDLGVIFRDTANVYGAGSSEEIVGRAEPERMMEEAASAWHVPVFRRRVVPLASRRLHRARWTMAAGGISPLWSGN